MGSASPPWPGGIPPASVLTQGHGARDVAVHPFGDLRTPSPDRTSMGSAHSGVDPSHRVRRPLHRISAGAADSELRGKTVPTPGHNRTPIKSPSGGHTIPFTMTGGARPEERSELARAMPAYEIGEVLGRGAFAVVYAARHVRLHREVAVKRLAPELLRERAARERFAAEARLLAKLDHPHVVRVHDYVEKEEVCALVMERLHGGSLAERAQIDRPSCVPACAMIV